MNTESKNPKIGVPEKIIVSGPKAHEDMHTADLRRIEAITKEFTEGFSFLEKYPRSVTFFGSARAEESDHYYQRAVSLARKIASELKYTVLTGGGPGIMEAANRGAFEAHGSSIGVTIKLPHEQITNDYMTAKVPLKYFFARKVCLSLAAEAYIFFPGGFGTFDELFEILNLVQTEKIQAVPIILVGSEFWTKLAAFLQSEIASRGLINQNDMQIYTIEDDEDRILEIIKKTPVR